MLISQNGDIPRRLVLDAGPIIALLHAADRDHQRALRGFRQLNLVRARLIVPLPIVFEVFKWLLARSGPQVARRGLQRMHDVLQIVYLDSVEIGRIQGIVATMPRWNGTLEDATVAAIGRTHDLPVWTLNYRDFTAFRDLRFWEPG